MMLEWLGERRRDCRFNTAATLLDKSVRAVFTSGRIRPFEFGGRDGTQAITAAVLDRLATNRAST
jgi:3-isopropylmalate dehydrogenase